MLTRTMMIAAMMAGACFGQNEADAAGSTESKYFHLDFVVKEVEGSKTINSRSYAMTVSTDRERSSIRSGNRVPVASAPRPAAGGTGITPFNFVDVGTNIDCWNTKEARGSLTLMVTADVSTAVEAPDAPAPVIRQVRWSSPVIVPLDKATVIFSSDDPSSKRQMQLEVTAKALR